MDQEEPHLIQTSLKTQSLWLVFAKLIGFILSFALPILIFRTLSKSEIGIYNQVFLVIVTVSGIIPLGVSMSAYYYLSRDREKQAFYVFNILLFNFVAGGFVCLLLNLYPQILFEVFKDNEMTQFAPQIGFVIWLWVFSSFLDAVAVANQEARLATLFIIGSQLTKAIFMISAVYFYGTVGAMLNAATIQAVTQTIVLMLYLNSRFKGFWHSWDKDLLIQHLKYALPFGLMSVLWTIQAEIHNYFVGYQFSPAEMAIYRAGCFELPLIYLIQESFSSVMIPRMSKLQSEGNKREMIELSVRAIEKLSLVYFPTFIFFLITAYTFVTTLFTKNFADSVPIFLINITLLPFAVFIADPIARAFSSIGRYMLKVRIALVIMLLLTLYYGIQHFDLKGMVMIVVATSLADRFASTIKIWKTVEIKLSDLRLLKNVGKTALVAIAAGVPTYFVYRQIQPFTSVMGQRMADVAFATPKETMIETVSGILTLGITGMFFGAVYLAGIFLFSVVTDEEKQFVRSKLVGARQYLGFARG